MTSGLVQTLNNFLPRTIYSHYGSCSWEVPWPHILTVTWMVVKERNRPIRNIAGTEGFGCGSSCAWPGMAAEPAESSLTLDPKLSGCLLRNCGSWKPSDQFLRMRDWILSETWGEHWWWENKVEKLGKTTNDNELFEVGRLKGAALQGRKTPGHDRTALLQPLRSGPLSFACRLEKATSGWGRSNFGTTHVLWEWISV